MFLSNVKARHDRTVGLVEKMMTADSYRPTAHGARIRRALSIAAAWLLFMSAPVHMSCAAGKKEPSNTERTGEAKAMPTSADRKILIAYFSRTGNTREIANQIHGIVGGDIFEIQPVKPYPADYDACVKQARQELDSGYRPELKTRVQNIESYDMVFIGYPNWWGTFPAPVRVFLTEYDFSGKKIVPFCTHEGSGLGRSAADIAKLCPRSDLLDGLAVRGSIVRTAQGKVADWLRTINITK
jgi:flavodoxin